MAVLLLGTVSLPGAYHRGWLQGRTALFQLRSGHARIRRAATLFVLALSLAFTHRAAAALTVGTAPVVVDVLVSGSGWALDPYSLVNGVNPTLPLPWLNLDTVEIVFDQNVDIELVSLSLIGVNTPNYTTPDPGIVFSYNPITFTARYIFPSPFSTDKLLLIVDGQAGDASPVRAAGGGPLLDGSSGPGTDFEQFFDILHGDANRNASTSVTDLLLVASKVPSFFPTSPYDPFADINGNHNISVTDVVGTAADTPGLLPPGTPGAGGCSAPSVVGSAGGCCLPVEQDCNGVCNGLSVVDSAGSCCLPAEQDCARVCNGLSRTDSAGACCLAAAQDCTGICSGSAVQDCNGVCGGPGVEDCNGVCDGLVGPDCLGNCFGAAVFGAGGSCCVPADQDGCGVCFGDGTGVNGCVSNCGGGGTCVCDACVCTLEPLFGPQCTCQDAVASYDTRFGSSSIPATPLTWMGTDTVVGNTVIPGRSLSFECWVNLEPEGGKGIPIFDRRGNFGPVYLFSVGVVGVRGTSLELRLSIIGSCSTCSVNGTTEVGLNEWHHVAFTWDHTTSTASLYLDGVLDGSGPFSPVGDALLLSKIMTSGGTVSGGMIDEMRMWSGVRTTQQIADNYQKSLVGFEPGLVFNHNFQQWTPGDLLSVDHSPNGLNMSHTVSSHKLITADRPPSAKASVECPNNCNNVPAACTGCGVCLCGGLDLTFDCSATGGGG